MDALPSTVRFFKIITTTSLEDGKFRIPNGFTRKYGVHMSNPLLLKTPDGKQWNIYWIKNDGDIWFQKGWKKFATHYSLDHGHMVLFEYEETSHFGVHIFDKSTVEIEYHFHSSQDEHSNLDRISEDSVEVLDELHQSKKTRPKSQMSCPQPHKKLRCDSSEDGGRNSKLQNFPKHVRVKEEMDGTTECVKVEKEQVELTSKIAEALYKARNFRSNYPSFTFVMLSTFVNQHLYVPSQFAKTHLKKKRSDILLQVFDERTWLVKYYHGRIGVGWKTFASDNNLKVGDVCRFELINSQALTLKVLIFRLGEKTHSPPPQESVQGDGVNWLDPVKMLDVESKTIISSEGSKATRRNSLRTSPRSFTKEPLNEANKFTSENPFFTTKVNIGPKHKPSVPNHFKKYFTKKKQILMLKFQKKMWPVKMLCYPYKSSNKFSQGWDLFVQECKLQTGDACVFELINREDAVLDVHIFRRHS